MTFSLRPLSPRDSLQELTDLLHEAYAPLAAMGLHFLATTQDLQTTRRRIGDGACFVAVDGRRLIGTITVNTAERTGGAPFYERPDVASFEQFAVAPDRQGTGIGRALVSRAEEQARAWGAAILALDTAEPATHLIEMYRRWGFERMGEADWRPTTNYPSVILGKRL